jgi:hypothetical protein
MEPQIYVNRHKLKAQSLRLKAECLSLAVDRLPVNINESEGFISTKIICHHIIFN